MTWLSSIQQHTCECKALTLKMCNIHHTIGMEFQTKCTLIQSFTLSPFSSFPRCRANTMPSISIVETWKDPCFIIFFRIFCIIDMIIHYDFAEDNFDKKNMRTFASHQWICEWVFLPKYSLPRNGSLLQCFAKHTISMWKATYWFFCCSSFRFRLNIDNHLIECTYMCNQYGFWCIICHMPYEFRMSVCHRYLAAVDWFLRNTECKPNFNCNVSHKK